MAKWGEGDPRWIVEERPDATNVNNWHWTEKNASQWSKDKLKELLSDLKIDDPSVGVAEITEATSIEGEAVANNRKAKLIFFYEWVIKGKWRGVVNGEADEVKGTFEVTNLSEENEADEVEVLISVKDKCVKKAGADVLKEMMRKKGADQIRKQLAKYISLLKSDFAKDLIKPTKDQVQGQDSKTGNINQTKDSSSKLQVNGLTTKTSNCKISSSDSTIGVKIDTKKLSLREEMKCRREELFRALTQEPLVSAFTRGPAKVDPEPGGKFSLFDGNVTGTFVSIREDEIKQRWRFKSWPEEHYSDVTLLLEEKEDHTLVILEQTGIPSSDFERTENGWKQMYFHSIKQTFGFGSLLY